MTKYADLHARANAMARMSLAEHQAAVEIAKLKLHGAQAAGAFSAAMADYRNATKAARRERSREWVERCLAECDKAHTPEEVAAAADLLNINVTPYGDGN